MRHLAFPLAILAVFAPRSIHAYSQDVHKLLSGLAYQVSPLGDGKLDLLDGLDLTPGATLPGSDQRSHTIVELLQRGAINEDDGLRFFNHFYDPAHEGAPLHPCSSPAGCAPSPSWALEDRSTFPSQTHSFRSARLAFLEALESLDLAAREASLGSTIEDLGHVVHHLQDMAQPQHVRNEPHPPHLYLWNDQARYEEDAQQALIEEKCEPYTPVRGHLVALPRQLWDAGDGTGIAEYTNRNFVTVGTDFVKELTTYTDPNDGSPRLDAETNPDYSDPGGTGLLITYVTYQDLQNQEIPCIFHALTTPPAPGVIRFLGNTIHDPVGSDEINLMASTLSLYDHDLAGCAVPGCEEARFTQNVFNFSSDRARLLPRAISQSASLIDYFFRGDIETCYGGPTAETWLKNHGAESMRGTLELFVEDAAGHRERLGAWTTAERLPQSAGGYWNSRAILSLPAFDPPINGKAFVVFHGDMGAELATSAYPGAIWAKRLDTTRQCVRRFWTVTDSGIVEYALNDDGLPTGIPTIIGPDIAIGQPQGVAFDASDGNLWLSVAGNGGQLFKMSRTGHVLSTLTVTGTFSLLTDGCGNIGDPQLQFGSLATDPNDVHSVWVTGSCGVAYEGQAPVYKVQTDTGAVAFRCNASAYYPAPFGGNGGGLLLGIGSTQHVGATPGTAFMVTRPRMSPGWVPTNYYYTFFSVGGLTGMAENCVPEGIWYTFGDISTPDFRNDAVYPGAVDIAGTRNRVVAVIGQCGGQDCSEITDTVYDLGQPSFGFSLLAHPISQVPIASAGDIALGSGF